MASPQKENGNTQIANELLEAIIRSGLNGTELSVLMMIIRKTYGWNKLEDQISLSQFVDSIPATKPSICKALKVLQLVKIIKLVKKGKSLKSSNVYAINKDYETWQLVKKSKLVKKTKSTSKENETQLVKKPLHTKDNIQKTLLQKKIKHLDFVELTEKEYSNLLEDFGKTKLNACIKKLDNFIPNKSGSKYKDHSRVIRGWVSEWYDKQNNTGVATTMKPLTFYNE